MKFESQLQIVTAAGVPPLTVNQNALVTNLNADLLDGQHGSFYQNAGNLNAGTVPLARLSGSYNIDITGSSAFLFVNDTRSSVTGPQTGYRQVRADFLANGTDGLSDGGSFHGVITFQQWADASGGGTRQLAFTDNDNLWIRGSGTGLTSYNAWKLMLNSVNYSSYALPLTGGTITGNLNLSAATLMNMGQQARIQFSYSNLQTVDSGSDRAGWLWNSYYDWSGTPSYKFWSTNAQGAAMLHMGPTQLTFYTKAGPSTANTAFSWDAANVVVHSGNVSTYALPSSGGSLSGSLSVSGNITITSGGSQFRASDGTAAAPGYSFNADTDTGIRRPSDNSIAIVTGGVDRLTFGSTGTATFSGQIASSVATGTAPLSITSTTLVSNLNADLLDGQHASYFENRDITAVGFASGSLTFTRAAGNITISMDGRYVPLSGGTMTGSLIVQGGNASITAMDSGNAAQWYGKVATANGTSDRQVYLGTYGTVAAIASIVNSTGAWNDLYVNTVDGSTGGTVRMPSSVLINGNQALHAGNYSSYAQPIGTNLPYSWTNTADVKVFTGAYSYNTGVAKYLLLWQRTSGATGTNGRFVDGMLKVWRGANHAGNGGTVGYIHASSGYSGTSSEVLVYTPFTGQALSFFSVIYNSVEWVAISLPISDYRWELRGHYGIQGDTTTVPIQVHSNDAGVGTITALTTTSYLLHTGTTSAPNLSIGGSAAQLNGQAASYYENRDTTAVGFASGTLTLTRAAGNLTVSLDGRYLPLTGGTLSGALTFSAASGTYINTGGGSDAFGYNATAGRGHYIKGTGNTYIYGGGVFFDGSAIRTLLHDNNYSSYALPLTGGTLTGNSGVLLASTNDARFDIRSNAAGAWLDIRSETNGYAAVNLYGGGATTGRWSAGMTGGNSNYRITSGAQGGGTVFMEINSSTQVTNFPNALRQGGNPVLSESVVTFTPTTVGWYRIATAGGNSQGTIRIAGFYDNRSAAIEFDYTVNGWNQECVITLRSNNTYAGSLITQIRASNDTGTANGYLDIYIATATAPAALTVYNFGPSRASLVASPVVGAVAGTNVVRTANINNIVGLITTGVVNGSSGAFSGPITITNSSTADGTGSLVLNGATNTERAIMFQDAGVNEWWFGRDNSGTVATGIGLYNYNTSNFEFYITDAGTAVFRNTVSASISGSAAQLNGQAASYYENRDTTAVGFSAGTLTLTRAAGNLTVSLDGRYLPLTGGTLTGVLSIQASSDNQLFLQGTDTWAGIGFRDSANVTDYIWYWGATQTFAIGGGGSSGVSGKKLHIDGGVTIGSGYDAVSMPTNGLNVEGAIQQAGNQVLHAANYRSTYITPSVQYTTVADASGYTWIRIPYASGGEAFNQGQRQVEFYVTRSINDNSNTPYAGCTAKFVFQSREWHSGQEMMTVQYGEHGGLASFGAAYFISHARVADQAGSGYWIYLRLKTNTTGTGITYNFIESNVGGIGLNINDIQSTTDPGSGTALYYGFNLISTGSQARFYRNANEVLDAGNVGTYALPIGGGTLAGNLTINGNLTSGSGYQLRWSDGSAASPAYSFFADTDTGIHRSDNNTLALVTGGTIRATVNSSGNLGVNVASALYRLQTDTAALFNRTAFGVLDISSNGSPNFIKIQTAIPFSYGSQAYTVNIRGFTYDGSQTVDITVCWHQYLDTFYNPTVSSSGSFAPTVRLARENSNVVICLTWGAKYWPKLYVESVHNFDLQAYSTGWSWSDADITGDKIVTLSYKNDWGGGMSKDSSGNLTVTGNITSTGSVTAGRVRGVNSLVLNTFTTVNPASNVFLYSQPNDRDAWIFLDSADTTSNWGIYHRQIDSAVSGLPANSIGFIGGGSSALQAWISLANGSAGFNGTVSAANFSGPGTGLTGTAASLSIGGTAATATLATKASTLSQNGGTGAAMTFNWSGQSGQPTWLWGGNDGVNHYVYNPANFDVRTATRMGVYDGTSYLAGANSIGSSGGRGVSLAPNTYQKQISFEFKNGTFTTIAGNYGGLITIAPWEGTTASTGDSSYQLFISSAAANSTSAPVLRVRAGIDTTWGSWATLIHDSNFSTAIPNSGVTAGTYNNVTVNAKGIVTGGSNAGYITGNQTITLSGDLSGSGSTAISATIGSNAITTTKINNSAVTYAKIQNVGAASVLGNPSASVSQAPQEITFANLGPYINGVARAWVTFNENPSTGAITINASFGISSVTRLAAGVYQVNFSTAFSDTHYAVSGTIGYESISAYTNGGYLGLTRTANPKTTTSCEVAALYGGTNYNARYVHVVFHR